MTATEKLFVYGTLRYAAVQRSTFGRLIGGAPDVLPGYTITMVTINDPHVVTLSKESVHPMLHRSKNESDEVQGMVLDLTVEELAQADSYEVETYKRTKVKLQSGIDAWAYVSAADPD